MNQILVISSHPDDMEIGMGGTIAKLVEQGRIVTSIVLTDGRRCPNPFSLTQDEIIQRRKIEARNAGEVLGIHDIHFCDLADLKQESNRAKAREVMGTILRRLNPDAVYTLHPDLDTHATHRSAGELTLQVISDTGMQRCEVWGYEVWGLFPLWDRLEDISNQIGKKLRAIAAHQSQIAAVPYGEGVAGLNRWRAVFADAQQTGVKAVFAEAFLRLGA